MLGRLYLQYRLRHKRIVIKKNSALQSKKAFSLIEVVLAMSIISFTCVTLLGLLGDGILTMHRAVNSNMQAGIIQAVINNSQMHAYASGFSTNMYFSDQGTEVTASDSTRVYTAIVTAQSLQMPVVSGSYTFNGASSGSVLLVAVSNRGMPNTTNSFSLVWPNRGN